MAQELFLPPQRVVTNLFIRKTLRLLFFLCLTCGFSVAGVSQEHKFTAVEKDIVREYVKALHEKKWFVNGRGLTVIEVKKHQDTTKWTLTVYVDDSFRDKHIVSYGWFSTNFFLFVDDTEEAEMPKAKLDSMISGKVYKANKMEQICQVITTDGFTDSPPLGDSTAKCFSVRSGLSVESRDTNLDSTRYALFTEKGIIRFWADIMEGSGWIIIPQKQ